MTLPRSVFPGTVSMVHRGCTHQQFLLRPDPEMNNAFLYCLAVAAQRHEVTVLDFVQMSNHLHDIVYDRHGNLPEFNRDFHSLLAKCVNSLRGHTENVFTTDQVNVVVLEDTTSIVDKLVYVATNPVSADLVEYVHQWPGASGHRALLERRIITARRPGRYFSENGDMPEVVTLELGIPAEVGDAAAILAEVKARVTQVERDAIVRRRAQGRTVLGRYAVLRQSWRSSPSSRLPRGALRPTFAGRSWAGVERAQRKKEFVAAHTVARKAFRAGVPILFPAGSYWWHRYAGAPVARRVEFH